MRVHRLGDEDHCHVVAARKASEGVLYLSYQRFCVRIRFISSNLFLGGHIENSEV